MSQSELPSWINSANFVAPGPTVPTRADVWAAARCKSENEPQVQLSRPPSSIIAAMRAARRNAS
jgi:hypothetical protein